MTPTILKLPVVKKRGRKVGKGPKADVVVIYELTTPTASPKLSPKEEMEKLAEVFRAREIEKRAQYEAWIELSPNVRRWPESRRYRSLDLVGILKKGGEDKEPDIDGEIAAARRRFHADVCVRRDQILAEQKRLPV